MSFPMKEMPRIVRRRYQGLHACSQLFVDRDPTASSAGTAQDQIWSSSGVRSSLLGGHRIRAANRHALALHSQGSRLRKRRQVLAAYARRFTDLVPPVLSGNSRGHLSWKVVQKLLLAMHNECNRRSSKCLLLWGGNRSVFRGAVTGETPASRPRLTAC